MELIRQGMDPSRSAEERTAYVHQHASLERFRHWAAKKGKYRKEEGSE